MKQNEDREVLKKPNRDRIVCIIQARMGSSRLPGKVMKEICGKPMIQWVVSRSMHSNFIDHVLIATTESESDDTIAMFCQKNSIACYRGNEFDVLDRYYQAAKLAEADIVVRLTADCPLVDAQLIDETIQKMIGSNADFCANRLPPPYKRTFPIGLDVEVVSMQALEIAWHKATKKYEREHVLPFVYDPQNGFNIIILDNEEDFGGMRWTVDTEKDLEFVRRVMKHLSCKMTFSWMDVLSVVKEYPDLEKINENIIHKTFREVDSRIDKTEDS